MEENHLPKNEFVREKIKEKPRNHKRIWRQAGIYALNGAVFALAMSVVFVLMIPAIRMKWEDAGRSMENDSGPDTAPPQTSQAQPVWNGTEEGPFSIEDYQRVQTQLYRIGNRSNRSVVTVTSVVSGTDWFDHSYEREGQGCGTIIADREGRFWILTEKKVIKKASSIHVTFVNGAEASADLVKYDGNTGLALLSVEKTELDSGMLSDIEVMEIENSGMVHKGSVVIALGNPAGVNGMILSGVITATGNEISVPDCNYHVYKTDIAANTNGSGIIINTDGRLVGMMVQNLGADSSGTLAAVDFTELKPVIDLLSAGADVPYFGAYVSTVSSRIAEKHGLPEGVYVREVSMDSPAMNAGLQSGDVILSVNKEKVSTVEQYNAVLLALTPKETYSVVIMREGAKGYKKITCRVDAGVLQ